MYPWSTFRAPVALSILACALAACGGSDGGGLGGATGATGTAGASTAGKTTQPAPASSDASGEPGVSYAP